MTPLKDRLIKRFSTRKGLNVLLIILGIVVVFGTGFVVGVVWFVSSVLSQVFG